MAAASDPPLAAAFRRAPGSPQLARNLAAPSAGAFALVLSAKIRVPLCPAPKTLKTLGVLALVAATVPLDLAKGFLRLPVFAAAFAGPACIVGPAAAFWRASSPWSP
jgi:biotin transporter BioY